MSRKGSFAIFGGFLQVEANDDHNDPISTCCAFHPAQPKRINRQNVLETGAQDEFVRKSAAEGFVNVDSRRTSQAFRVQMNVGRECRESQAFRVRIRKSQTFQTSICCHLLKTECEKKRKPESRLTNLIESATCDSPDEPNF
jgi:hypothetical protein